MTAEWWFSKPNEYVINIGKDGKYGSISPYEFLATFVLALESGSSLDQFARQLLNVQTCRGLKHDKKRFDTWDLQNYLKENPNNNGKYKIDNFTLTANEVCEGVIFIFSVMDIYEDDGLGDPRMFLLEKLRRMLN